MAKKSDRQPREMSSEELASALTSDRKKLYELRSQSVTEKLENPRQLGALRKQIARYLTEQRARQIAAQESN